MDFEGLRRIALALPETREAATHFNLPSFKVRDRNFVALEKGETHAVLYVDETQAQAAVAEDPSVFEEARGRFDKLIGVRVALARVPAERLQQLVELAWRNKAPRRLVAAFDDNR